MNEVRFSHLLASAILAKCKISTSPESRAPQGPSFPLYPLMIPLLWENNELVESFFMKSVDKPLMLILIQSQRLFTTVDGGKKVLIGWETTRSLTSE